MRATIERTGTHRTGHVRGQYRTRPVLVRISGRSRINLDRFCIRNDRERVRLVVLNLSFTEMFCA